MAWAVTVAGWRQRRSGDGARRVGSGSPLCQVLDGSRSWDVRRTLQAGFNRPRGYPGVLIAQSLVGREGLDLHEACRVVVLLHAEWNPGVLEQQVGRVDRKGSRWRTLWAEWVTGPQIEPPPVIHVRQLVFRGTYDDYQWDRVTGRKRQFDAALFGSLLPVEEWELVPRALVAPLESAAPDFSPTRLRGRPLRRARG